MITCESTANSESVRAFTRILCQADFTVQLRLDVFQGGALRIVRIRWMLGNEMVLVPSKTSMMLQGKSTFALACSSHFFRHLCNSSWKVCGSGGSEDLLAWKAVSCSSERLSKKADRRRRSRRSEVIQEGNKCSSAQYSCGLSLST